MVKPEQKVNLAWRYMVSALRSCWVLVISPPNSQTVALAGYKAFLRGTPFWGLYTFAWGYTLAPYAVFAGVTILVAIRLVGFRIEDGFWNWRTSPLRRVDLTSGTSRSHSEPHMPRWERNLDAVFDRF